jgi:N6-adenosine-specific RNA methylase IME4
MLEGLRHGHYACITADIPWKYKVRSTGGLGKSAERHYQTMDLWDVARMPVVQIAAADAFLFFWVTGPFLAIGGHIAIMRAWGFEPSAIWGVWLKPTKKHWENGTLLLDDALWKMGMGHTSRQNAEFVVIGRRGNPRRQSKAVRQIMMEPLREHSRKPEKFFENVERFSLGPRLELFGRQQREGWVVRGHEADKFR